MVYSPPSLPGQLLSRGQFAQNVTVMVGHNAQEAPSFTPPYIETDADVKDWAKLNFPGISDAVADYIAETLYPAVYDGSQTYSSPWNVRSGSSATRPLSATPTTSTRDSRIKPGLMNSRSHPRCTGRISHTPSTRAPGRTFQRR